MKYGLCTLSVVPIRSTASDTAEMTTQLLFGEIFEVLDQKGKHWLKIRCQIDHYIGWVRRNQVSAITPSEFSRFQQDFHYCLEFIGNLVIDEHTNLLPLGSRLPAFENGKFQLEEKRLAFSGQTIAPLAIPNQSDWIKDFALRYLNVPFLNGGRSPFGIDSAGLVQMVFQFANIKLPREAQQQVMFGQTIDFVDQAQIGDLAFFESRTGKVNHVGIVVGRGKILHAYGKVRQDRLDHYGIFDESVQQYTHKLRVVRRLFNASASSNSTRNPAYIRETPADTTVVYNQEIKASS